MKIAEELAARIVAFKFDALPAEAINNAKRAILDTVAVTLAGSGMDSVRILARVLGLKNDGQSVVFGSPLRTDALNAALVNDPAFSDIILFTVGNEKGVPFRFNPFEFLQEESKRWCPH